MYAYWLLAVNNIVYLNLRALGCCRVCHIHWLPHRQHVSLFTQTGDMKLPVDGNQIIVASWYVLAFGIGFMLTDNDNFLFLFYFSLFGRLFLSIHFWLILFIVFSIDDNERSRLRVCNLTISTLGPGGRLTYWRCDFHIHIQMLRSDDGWMKRMRRFHLHRI